MARLLRIEYPGAIYHVTFRGNEKKNIFKSDADRRRLMEQLAVARDSYQARIYLACLMPNHVHLLLETPQGNLSAFMGQLLTAYTVYFNRKHRRVGHLMQGRFNAKLVEGDSYLLKLSRYVHLNPVSGKPWHKVNAKERCDALRAYRWSTYRSYAGMEKPWAWIEYNPLLAMVAVKGASPAESYQEYVERGLVQSDKEFSDMYQQSRLGLGSAEFVEELRLRYQQSARGRRRQEDAALRKRTGRSPMDEVLKWVALELGVRVEQLKKRRRNSLLRAAAAWALQRYSGMNQREVAEVLGMGSGASVSQQMAKWRVAVSQESRWRAMAEQMDQHFAPDH